MSPFALDVDNAVAYAVRRGLVSDAAAVEAEELGGGVSASVVAVRGEGVGIVLKQALPQLRVQDEWLARVQRTDTEAAAMRLCGRLTPDAVPEVLDHDPVDHVVAIELAPPGWANWQAEIGEGRVHADAAPWAGEVLGTWHRETASSGDVAAAFDEHEAFEELRLRPFHETVMRRRPELAGAIAPYLAALREQRRCLVHGDYAKKNILVGADGRWVLDFEVAHYGNPLFDLGFFLSFVLLSAVRWPGLEPELRRLEAGFLRAYLDALAPAPAPAPEEIAGHTACLVLARTDGTSPAAFLDEPSRERARAVGTALLADPAAGLWGPFA